MKRIVGLLAIVMALSISASAVPTYVYVDAQLHTTSAPLNTGIWVTSGDPLTIVCDTSDTWTMKAGDPTRESNADGLVSWPTQHTYGGLTANYGAMVGRIDSGAYFVVGTSFVGTANATGQLQLMAWDSAYADNGGAIRADVTAVPAPGALLLGGLGTCLVGWLRRRTA